MATSLRHLSYKLPRFAASSWSPTSIGTCSHHLKPSSSSWYGVNRAAYCTKSPSPSAVVKASSPWQIMSAVCLERFPVISQDLDNMQSSYQNLVDQEEYEESYLSLHEISVAKELESLAQRKKGVTSENEEELEGSADTSALESEDRAKLQLQSFVTASRITEADKNNDLHSVERNLADRLILLVKSKLGSDKLWMMPQGNWLEEEEESLKQTAERVLASHCGNDDLRAKFMSAVPCGFYKYKYPKAVREEGGKIGAKVFFFKARYVEGDFQLNTNVAEDYVWVTLDELDQYLNQSYAHKVKKFIFPITIPQPSSATEDVQEPQSVAAS